MVELSFALSLGRKLSNSKERSVERLILTRPVTLTGRDVFGRPAWITLEPTDGIDWVWRLPDGRDIPIMPYMIEHRRRRAVVAYDNYLLNEIEHVGILRAYGARNIRVSVGPHGWPPYDGCAHTLWRTVLPRLEADGELLPYRTAPAVGIDPSDQTRRVYYSPEGTDLNITGIINYFMLQGANFSFCHNGRANLLPLVRARTLGWPPSIKYPLQLASMLGLWPHEACINWPFDRPSGEVLEEAGRHRMLDLLGLLNFAAPARHHLTGWINSQKGGHRTDVRLLRQIAPTKVMVGRTLQPEPQAA